MARTGPPVVGALAAACLVACSPAPSDEAAEPAQAAGREDRPGAVSTPAPEVHEVVPAGEVMEPAEGFHTSPMDSATGAAPEPYDPEPSDPADAAFLPTGEVP